MATLEARSVRRAIAVLAVLLLVPGASLAVSTGVATPFFGAGAAGCPFCHFGGAVPGVVLSGPTIVTPGNTYPFTLTVFGNPLQTHGGFNVSAPDGVFSLGGPYSSNTRTIIGLGGRTEITHSAPKDGDLINVVEFSFQWTAPAAFTSVTISGWGNAVNLNFGTSGDNAAFDSLQVFPDGVPFPTNTPTPTPTPTPPLAPCGDAVPLDPTLLDDAAQQRCQAAVGKAGFLYLKQHLNAARVCLRAFQRGDLSGDPFALCVGTTAVPPTDAVASGKLAKAESKVRSVLSGKCDDGVVAALDFCAETESMFEDCFLQAHRQRAVEAIAGQYGTPTILNDQGAAKCQADVAKAAAKYVSAHQRASQKCLNTRNKKGAPTSGAGTLCVGALVGGVLQQPDDPKAAQKVSAASAKLIDKINRSCTEVQVAALGLCADTRAGLVSCLSCAQTSAVLGLLADEYSGN